MEGILARALGQDVSNLAAQEKQLLLSRLLARLAHEIRNPLSSLDIHVQLLEEDLSQAAPELREKTMPRLEIVRGELHRLENIVKQFLSLAGPSTIERQEVCIPAIIAHVSDLLRPEALSRDIKICMDVPCDFPAVVADRGQLTQALVNLMINAIQAIGKEGTVSVSAAVDAANRVFFVAVRDTGPGLAAQERSAIFEPFFTTKAEGSGLGLWIVQQIAIAHGGDVQASNAPEGGALFRLELPLITSETPHG
jgi:signal transduction histidine kinase